MTKNLSQPKVKHVSDLVEASSWRNYKKSILDMELDWCTPLEMDEFTSKSAQDSFLVYAKTVKPDISIALYHEVVGSAFEDIAEGKFPILLVSGPPRIGKSMLGSLLLSWLISKDPSTSHIVSSYAGALSRLIVNKVSQYTNSSRVAATASNQSMCGYGYGGFYETPGLWLS